MRSNTEELPEEVKAALDDLRRIREVVDVVSDEHPMRRIARPLMLYTMIAGLSFAVFGVVAQLVLDSEAESIAGLSPVGAVWVLGAVFLGATAAVKNTVFVVISRRAGYDVDVLLRSIFNSAYRRVILGIFFLMALGTAALVVVGAESMILGLITAATGAVWFILPAVLPIKEFTWLGASLMVLGGLSMFLYPEWTFYKLSVIWGLPLTVGGLLLYRRFPPLPGAEARKG